MSVKTLRPFVLILAVLLVLAGIRYGMDRQRPSIVTQTRLEALVDAGVTPEALRKLVLYSGAKPEETVELVRDGDAWHVATLHQAPVDAGKVDAFLEKLVALKGEPRAIAKGDDDLKPYGLQDGEAFRVRAFTDPAGQPAIDLVVGKSPDFRTVFMRKAGAMNVYVEAANLRREAGIFAEEADAAPASDHWLDKTILALDREQVKRLAFTLPDKSFTLDKVTIEEPAAETPPAEEGAEPAPPPAPTTRTEWQVSAGAAGLTFKESGVGSLLTKLSALTCTTVVDPAEKETYGLNTPAFRLAIALEDGTEKVLVAGRPDLTGDAYLAVEGASSDLVYKLDSFTFEQLFPKGQSLFDLPALGVAQDTVGSISIEQPEGRVVLSKTEGEWKVTEPSLDLPVQSALISTLVSTLGTWRPADFADVGANLGEPSRTLRVTAGETTHVLHALGDAASQDGLYVRVDGVDTPLVMARTDISRLFLKPRDVFQLTLLGMGEDEVRNVFIKTADANFALEQGEDGWKARAGGVEHPVDAEKARELVAKLASLQADDIRLDRSNIGGDPMLNIGVRTADSLPRYLAIGPEEAGQHFISLSGLNTTFQLSSDTVRELNGLIGTLLPQATAADAAADAPEVTSEAVPEPAPAPAPESAPSEAPVEAPATDAAPAPESAPAEAPVEAPALDAAPAAESAPAEAPVEVPATEPAPAPAPEPVPAEVPAS